MDNYQEIRLNKYRNVVCFSLLFLSFFGGKFWFTGCLFGAKTLKQQKIRYRTKLFDDGWTYLNYWSDWRFKWEIIN